MIKTYENEGILPSFEKARQLEHNYISKCLIIS